MKVKREKRGEWEEAGKEQVLKNPGKKTTDAQQQQQVVPATRCKPAKLFRSSIGVSSTRSRFLLFLCFSRLVTQLSGSTSLDSRDSFKSPRSCSSCLCQRGEHPESHHN
jgi:hypothetical protein